MIPRPGERLREIRRRAGLTTRAVEGASRTIALRKGSPEFFISHAWLTRIEKGKSRPSPEKLFTLSAIYGASLAGLYRDLENLPDYQMAVGREHTHPVEISPDGPPGGGAAAFDLGSTALLPPGAVANWSGVFAAILGSRKPNEMRYGFIGLSDRTPFPILRPGSFVVIDPRQRTIDNGPFGSELERPVYFVETRGGYFCAWCQMQGGELIVEHHTLSACPSKRFKYPGEADVIGRVVAVAGPLVEVRGEPHQPRAHGAAAGSHR